jgi:ATP-dependent DNA ligase
VTATAAITYTPALCQATSALPARLGEWLCEPKLDGIRLQVRAQGGQVTSTSRNGLRYDGRLPSVEAALSALDVVLDGEVVWFDPESGLPDFHKGSGLFRREDSAQRQRFEGPLTYVAFDILELAGQDVRRMPIETRRALLAQLVEGLACPQLRLIEQTDASPEAQANYVRRFREGVVLKAKGSRYPTGRTPNWLKMKVVAHADVVITGFEVGNGKYSNTLGCVQFSQWRDGELVQRGTCSGMTDAERDAIWANTERYLGKVLVIRHMGADGEGFRHPQWDHLRTAAEGKNPEDCTWE